MTTPAQPPNVKLPNATQTRLSLYLRAVCELEAQQVVATGSQQLAELCGVPPFQVRKDLAYCGRLGRRGQGYAVRLLRRELTRTLGLDRRWHYIVVGLGHLGKALLEHPWGEQFVCVGLFDPDPQHQGQKLYAPALPQTGPRSPLELPPVPRELRVRPLGDLEQFVQEQTVDLALLSVGAAWTQGSIQALQGQVGGILNVGSALLEALALAADAASPKPHPHLQDSGHEENVTVVEQVDFQVSLQRLAFAVLQRDTPYPLEESS